MHSVDLYRRARPAWCALAVLGLALLLAAAAPRRSSAMPTGKVIGYMTWVKGGAVTVDRKVVDPFGEAGWDKTADSVPLHANDEVVVPQGGVADYMLSIKNSEAFCRAKPGTVKVLPGNQNVLLEFDKGNNSCGLHTKGATRVYFRAGSALRAKSSSQRVAAPAPTVVSTSVSDPIFKVVVTASRRTINVGRGVLVVSGAGGGQQAVVVGKNQQTVVSPGGTPTAPSTAAPSQADKVAYGQLASALPKVPDVKAPHMDDPTGPSDPSSLRTATFAFDAEPRATGTTFSCALDGTDFRLCTSPWAYTNLAPGQHTFRVQATNTSGNTSPVAHLEWTIDHSKIVFESTRDGEYQIYSMNSDGTDVTDLSRSGANDKDPAWSRDGSKIVFQSDRDPGGDTNIYVMNADGSNQTRLTTGRFNGNPAWSPDGRQIVFESTRTGRSEIYVMNADGSHQTQITFDDPIATDAAWSPDGTRIAYASTLSGRYQIYTVSPGGGKSVRVTNADATELGPTWSPDGSRIAFYSDRDKAASRIYTMNPDGTDVKPVTVSVGPTSTVDSNPTWAPDGHELAFQRFFPDTGVNDLYVVSADNGTGLAKLTAVAGVKGDGLVPNWDSRYPAVL